MQISVTVCALILFIASVHAHVVENFEECRQYFYRDERPVWPTDEHHVEICQTYRNESHFATLYDTKYRIPVYSAYVFEEGNKHPKMPWCVEPQLVNKDWDKNMVQDDKLKKKHEITIDEIGEKQAVYEDYLTLEGKEYNRGHLNPRGHHSGIGSEATFTLTNVVPQNKQLNKDAWSKYEDNLKNVFSTCHKAFVLVGAIPSSENWIERNDQKRVNIPDYLWHAYCCEDKNGKPSKSGAAVAMNTEENVVQNCSLTSLQEFFNDLNKKPELFKNCNAPVQPEGDCSSVIQ